MNGRRIRTKIACLLLVFLIMGQTLYASAFPFTDNPVIDSFLNLFGEIRYDVTIAELVISLLTGAGATPVNNAMVTALEQELGTASYQIGQMADDGLFSVVQGTFLDNGFIDAIEDTAVWAKYGLEDIFATTVNDIGLDGEAAIEAVGAANLGAVIANAAYTGGVIIGTAGVASLAIGGGVAVGVLIDHIVRNWGGYIEKGVPLEDYNKIINDKLAAGASFGYAKRFRTNGKIWTTYQITMENGITTGVENNGSYSVTGWTNNTTPGTITRYEVNYNTDGIATTGTVYTSNVSKNSSSSVSISSPAQGEAEYTFSNFNDRNAFIDQWRGNGSPITDYYKISPDIIGRQGNIQAQKDNNGNVVYPGMSTPIQEGKGLKPINWNDYRDFVDEANQNFTDDPTNQEDQIQAWKDFVDPYIDEVNESPENPDNPDQPVVPDPDANYVPDLTDDITPDTIIDDVVLDDVIDDVVPDQPVIPDKPDLTPEEIDDNLDVSVSGDITDIFPFCIPFDVIALFERFGDIGREAPRFYFVIDLGQWGEYPIDIDLAEWEDVATLCRTLEIALFILGLILVTRELIRG